MSKQKARGTAWENVVLGMLQQYYEQPLNRNAFDNWQGNGWDIVTTHHLVQCKWYSSAWPSLNYLFSIKEDGERRPMLASKWSNKTRRKNTILFAVKEYPFDVEIYRSSDLQWRPLKYVFSHGVIRYTLGKQTAYVMTQDYWHEYMEWIVRNC